MANSLFFIRPKNAPSAVPQIDRATKLMTTAFRAATRGPSYRGNRRGFHICDCGAISSNCNYFLRNKARTVTNSLCVHYLAFHREEVPADQLAFVLNLICKEANPTRAELAYPPKPKNRPYR
ncbi:MAG: hypothetical protein Q7S36_01555 [Candidatus Liptonbacteria bacterium]|nr:hypothetical protein [Candidatus Liptonbacteria bacterium]